MNTSIGIRVKPDEVLFTVVSEEEAEIELKLIDKIIVPKALETPEQLKFVRGTLKDIINENRVTVGCIRISESTARSISYPRVYLEGVIQELIASSSIEKYFIGRIANISAYLDIPRDKFKVLANGEEKFRDLEIWDDLSLESRESVLSAFSALNI